MKSYLHLVNDFIKSYISVPELYLSVLQLLTACEIKKRGNFDDFFIRGLFLLIQGEVHSVINCSPPSHICVVFTKSQT